MAALVAALANGESSLEKRRRRIGSARSRRGISALSDIARDVAGRSQWRARGVVPDDAPPPHPDGLSPREVEVLRLIAAGRSNREIGEHLMISPNTAANHVRAILQKTACANRAEAAAYAARNDLLG